LIRSVISPIGAIKNLYAHHRSAFRSIVSRASSVVSVTCWRFQPTQSILSTYAKLELDATIRSDDWLITKQEAQLSQNISLSLKVTEMAPFDRSYTSSY